MRIDDHIAKISNLIGDKTRAAMLVSLMEGRALTSGELARVSNISPQTASNHLKKLMEANLVVCLPSGRHRYYNLTSPDVARALEALSILSEPPKKCPHQRKLNKDICFARTCYDHLAGELGVRVTKALLAKNIISEKENAFHITKKGQFFFSELNIDIGTLAKQNRKLTRPCLDWTERRHHLAGCLGAAILNYFLEQRLVIRVKNKPRVIMLTTKGNFWLKNKLDIIF